MAIEVMDTTTVISLTVPFLKMVGEVVADLKRQELAQLDVDLLKVKRTELSERLDDFTSDMDKAVKHEKARAVQDSARLGMANTTVPTSNCRAIEQDASTELARATREYNRAIEEIALLEQKINVRSHRWWKPLRCWGSTMNTRQLKTFWISIGIIAVMLLFPPWQFYLKTTPVDLTRAGPYHFIFLGAPKWYAWTPEVDWVRLILPIVIVVIVAAGLMVTFRSRE